MGKTGASYWREKTIETVSITRANSEHSRCVLRWSRHGRLRKHGVNGGGGGPGSREGGWRGQCKCGEKILGPTEQMKLTSSEDGQVEIKFLQEAAINTLSNGINVECEEDKKKSESISRPVCKNDVGVREKPESATLKGNSLVHLRKHWDNVKSKRKRELAEETLELMSSGQGPYKSHKPSCPKVEVAASPHPLPHTHFNCHLGYKWDGGAVAAAKLHQIFNSDMIVALRFTDPQTTSNASKSLSFLTPALQVSFSLFPSPESPTSLSFLPP
uniref:Uncharacterized protein n=1 Tax=Timema cristinae TaxID=61476 RepID=A0A7R9GYQ2_TIMCR|nr:unnamed protein product [Timema cristinae]